MNKSRIIKGHIAAHPRSANKHGTLEKVWRYWVLDRLCYMSVANYRTANVAATKKKHGRCSFRRPGTGKRHSLKA